MDDICGLHAAVRTTCFLWSLGSLELSARHKCGCVEHEEKEAGQSTEVNQMLTLQFCNAVAGYILEANTTRRPGVGSALLPQHDWN